MKQQRIATTCGTIFGWMMILTMTNRWTACWTRISHLIPSIARLNFSLVTPHPAAFGVFVMPLPIANVFTSILGTRATQDECIDLNHRIPQQQLVQLNKHKRREMHKYPVITCSGYNDSTLMPLEKTQEIRKLRKRYYPNCEESTTSRSPASHRVAKHRMI